jgi:Na(+)/H(+) exchange regulatory cofactor NHE-RF2
MSTSRRKMSGHHQLPDNAPRPRHCTVTKCPDFDGYGFNLHAEKARPGQYIGKVDPGSPAEAAGMKEGDRIVEVNAVNISHENHKQVVQRIKAVEDESRLLLLDSEAETYYKQNDIVVRGDMDNILYLCSSNSRDLHRNSSSSHHVGVSRGVVARNSYEDEAMSDERRSNGSEISSSGSSADKVSKPLWWRAAAKSTCLWEKKM